MPIVSTFCAGTHREPLSNSHALDVVPVAHSTRLRVDLREDVLVYGLLETQEFARPAVEFPEDPVFPDAEHHGSAFHVHEHSLEGLIQVEGFAGNVGEEPDDFPRLGVEGQRRVRVKRGVCGGQSLTDRHPRLGLGGAKVHPSEHRIPASRNPDLDSAPKLGAKIAPSISPGLAGVGDGEGPKCRQVGARPTRTSFSHTQSFPLRATSPRRISSGRQRRPGGIRVPLRRRRFRCRRPQHPHQLRPWPARPRGAGG